MKNLVFGLILGIGLGGLAFYVTSTTQKKDAEVVRTATPHQSASDSQVSSNKKVKIGVSLPGADHAWLGAVKRNAEVAAQNHQDVELIMTDGQNKSAKQMADVETLIHKEVDVIVMLPHSGKALTPVARKIREAGIPLVILDREIESQDFYTLIRGNNYGIGVQAARYIGKKLNGKGKVAEVMGLAGISVTTERHQGFVDTLKKEYPNIQVVASVAADFNADKALTVAENILQANPKLDAIYSHDDDQSLGILKAVKHLGRENELFITGAGGSRAMMEEIKSGSSPVKASFLYNPAMAGSAVNIARLVAQKKGLQDLWEPDVAREIVIRASAVTSENVDKFIHLGY